MSSQSFSPKPGALRFKTSEGDYSYANPNDLLYSTVTMVATEYWDEASQSWKRIHEDSCESKTTE